MIDLIETLHHTLATWLVNEELLLRETAHPPSPAALASRLDLWQKRLRAYERLERALNLLVRPTPDEIRPEREPVDTRMVLLAS